MENITIAINGKAFKVRPFFDTDPDDRGICIYKGSNFIGQISNLDIPDPEDENYPAIKENFDRIVIEWLIENYL